MVIAVLGVILLGYFRTWLVRKFFVKVEKVQFLKFFILSGSLVTFLLGSQYLLHKFHLSLDTFSGFYSFCWMLSVFLWMLWCIFYQKNTKSWMILGILLGFFVFIGTGSLSISALASVTILLLSVMVEEYLKIGTSSLVFEKNGSMKSDLIFFSLLIATGFSFFENCYYLIDHVASIDLENLVFWRGILSSLLHLFATGVIALIFFKGDLYGEQSLRKSIVIILVGFLSGVLVHFLYDLPFIPSFLIYGVVLIGGYFFLTYLFYLSDQLYLEKKE